MNHLRDAIAADPARFAPFPPAKYEPERILGAGGFGVAILCRNRHSGGQVVVKTMRRDGLDRDIGEVFREAQALEELDHPAVIRVRDCDYADEAGTRPYFVMDYFAGETLADHVGQYGPLDTNAAVDLAKRVASGLAKAHARGILHRDVKPGNLLVRQTFDGLEVKLIDFGLALRAVDNTTTMKSSLDLTLAGASIAGTLDYAAPEQMGKLKGVAVGPYSDVYGFGKTICYALFGTPQPTFLHWKAVPTSLAELLGRCLSEQPRDRPQHFTEVLRQLEATRPAVEEVPVLMALLAEEEEAPGPRPAPRPRSASRPRSQPVPTRPLPRREVNDRPGKRGSSVAILVAFGVMAFLVVAGGLYFFASRGRQRTATVGLERTVKVPRVEQPFEAFSTKAKWPPSLDEVKVIPMAEFPAVLAELEKKPAIERLRVLAGRLAITPPTESQKKKHEEAMQAAGRAKNRTAPKEQTTRLAAQDDVTRVSAALQPLLERDDLESRWYGAKACQFWGTKANVVALIGLTSCEGYGGDSVRGAACRALGAIGDPRGIEPVVKRAVDQWDSGHQTDDLVAALEAFGSQAEEALLPHVKKGVSAGAARWRFACSARLAPRSR